MLRQTAGNRLVSQETESPDSSGGLKGLWSLCCVGQRVKAVCVAWFLRAIELPGGQWACSRGGVQIDVHPRLQHAVDHLQAVGAGLGPFEIFVHRLDGLVSRLDEPDG